MNLIVDIGNSSAKVAIFQGDKMILRERQGKNLIESLCQLAADFEIEACAFSSVGTSRQDVDETLRKLSPFVLRVDGMTPTPLICDYLTPETLGADRLAASVGAMTCCPGHPLMIIDAGTCITYDFVSADGHYTGGNISPGLGMRLRALHNQTALLPLVGSEGPVPAIGCNTETAIRTGVIQGMEFEIEGYIRTFRRLYKDARVFITGGNGFRFALETDVERNDALVEIGLNKILTHNR